MAQWPEKSRVLVRSGAVAHTYIQHVQPMLANITRKVYQRPYKISKVEFVVTSHKEFIHSGFFFFRA